MAGWAIRALGVCSRIIPATESWQGVEHQNVGIFYRVHLTDRTLRPEPNVDTVEPGWVPIPDVGHRRRSSLVDVGLALARTHPPTGHMVPVPA